MTVEGPSPPASPISLWILFVFFAGGIVTGSFAALRGNWFDVFLAALLVVASLYGIVKRYRA